MPDHERLIKRACGAVLKKTEWYGHILNCRECHADVKHRADIRRQALKYKTLDSKYSWW